uniref:Claudin 7 n=1 Tax=Latimeria chalumnae TaxID=7897 RepID=H3AJ93_LATCH
SLLVFTAALQATRALMVVSILVSALAMGISAAGMKCTKCGGNDKVKKARTAMGGGITFLLGGLAALIGTSWYGHRIVREFYDPFIPVNAKYEFGSAIFIGWAGAALVVLGGALLAASCPGRSGGSYAKHYPKAKSKAPSSTQDYV